MDHEDTDDIEAVRRAAERVSGWNGSRVPYLHEERSPGVRPAAVHARLQQLRAAAEVRAQEQRKKGLCV